MGNTILIGGIVIVVVLLILVAIISWLCGKVNGKEEEIYRLLNRISYLENSRKSSNMFAEKYRNNIAELKKILESK